MIDHFARPRFLGALIIQAAAVKFITSESSTKELKWNER
jgi:hypothetical protein